MTIAWPHVARNLAAHLHAVREPSSIIRILDNAERDVASLGAPTDWWEMVVREYRALTGPGSDQDHDAIVDLIRGRAMR